MLSRKAVVTMCVDKSVDPVAPYAFEQLERAYELLSTGKIIDDFEVKRLVDANGNEFDFVPTRRVMPHDYPRYVPLINEHFPNAECVVVLNWHEGVEAPDDIMTIHVNGDIPSGLFSQVDPFHIRNVLIALEENRIERGLDHYRVLTEPTHWSGLISNQDTRQIAMLRVPIYDLEIGSSIRCWQDNDAIGCLLQSVMRIFDPQPDFSTLLCVGGMHFVDDYANSVVANKQDFPISLTHTFHTRWIENADYLGETGKEKFRSAIKATIGGIDGIVFHQNIKGVYKQLLRELADEFGVTAFHHKALRRMDPAILVKTPRTEVPARSNSSTSPSQSIRDADTVR